jgi:hypothetical protein
VAQAWPQSPLADVDFVKPRISSFGARILFSALVLLGLNASAEQYRWDFSGTLNGTLGSGSVLPGVVVGATFAGYVQLDTSDLFWYFHGAFDTWSDDSLYRSPSATLTYTVTYAGNSYAYSATGIQFGVATGTAAYGKDIVSISPYDYSVSLWNLTPSALSRITDTSFASFVSGMSTDLAGSASSFALVGSDPFENGATASSLTSFGPVPEPSVFAFLPFGLVCAAVLKLGRNR